MFARYRRRSQKQTRTRDTSRLLSTKLYLWSYQYGSWIYCRGHFSFLSCILMKTSVLRKSQTKLKFMGFFFHIWKFKEVPLGILFYPPAPEGIKIWFVRNLPIVRTCKCTCKCIVIYLIWETWIMLHSKFTSKFDLIDKKTLYKFWLIDSIWESTP